MKLDMQRSEATLKRRVRVFEECIRGVDEAEARWLKELRLLLY